MPIQHVNEVVTMLPVHKLYVGLSCSDSLTQAYRNNVVKIVAGRIESFTITDALGYFRGMPEQTLVITIAHDDYELVETIADELRVQLRQDGIGLECEGMYYRVTTLHSARLEV